MGKTGVGKSTVRMFRANMFSAHVFCRVQFINTLLGEGRMCVGHSITSCTSTLEHVIIDGIDDTRIWPAQLRGHRVVIVDTPGFDDTYDQDFEILRRIAVWLASS